MATRTFGNISNEEIEEKRLQMNAGKTLKQNEAAASVLKDYLKHKGMDVDFETFDNAKLGEILSHFYMDVRKTDGSYYKATSLNCLRHALNRYLKGHPHNKKFDILRDPAFAVANEHFKAAVSELRRIGFGDVAHYPPMKRNDIRKLYTSLYLSPNSPMGLQNKVQFDIRLYFCRRGVENMITMTKSSFEIKTNPDTGEKFVSKCKDDYFKNPRTNEKDKTEPGLMPEVPGSEYCPVRTFEKYLSKLHPSCDRLWQRPKDEIERENDIWYRNAPVGEKSLAMFMTNLSKKCNLSQVYTNHSLRATRSTILAKGGGPVLIGEAPSPPEVSDISQSMHEILGEDSCPAGLEETEGDIIVKIEPPEEDLSSLDDSLPPVSKKPRISPTSEMASSEDDLGPLQREVLMLQKTRLNLEIEKLKMEKDKLKVETEKLEMEKEKLKLEKNKLAVEIAKLSVEVQNHGMEINIEN